MPLIKLKNTKEFEVRAMGDIRAQQQATLNALADYVQQTISDAYTDPVCAMPVDIGGNRIEFGDPNEIANVLIQDVGDESAKVYIDPSAEEQFKNARKLESYGCAPWRKLRAKLQDQGNIVSILKNAGLRNFKVSPK